MAQELVYTSAPRGLRLGSSGFCAVACTRGMAPNYLDLLESLSAYAPVYPPSSSRARLNPTVHSHYRFVIGGKAVDVVSRVAFAGADYSGRTNKFAHHLALDANERPLGGPAWLLSRPGLMLSEWVGEPRFIERSRTIPQGDVTPAPCDFWARQTGDAGWAGVLAQSLVDAPKRPSFVVFEPGMPTLELAAEALRLLPPAQRWEVGFCTYFSALPVGTQCGWRFCLSSSAALKVARQTPDAVILDLTRRSDQPEAARRVMQRGSQFIEAARRGDPPPFEIAPAAETPESADGPEGGAARPLRLQKPAPAPPPRPVALRPVAPSERGGPGMPAWLWVLLGGLALAVVVLAGLLWYATLTANDLRDMLNGVENRVKDREATTGRLNASRRRIEAQLRRLRQEQATGARALEQSEANVATLKGRVDRMKRESDQLRADLGKAREALRARTSSRPKPPTRKVRYDLLKRCGDMAAVAEEVKGEGSGTLAFKGARPNMSVFAIGWWPGDEPGKGVHIERDGRRLNITGPHTVGGRVPFVAIAAEADGVRFRKGREANAGQVEDARLGRLAWVVVGSKWLRRLAVCRRESEMLLSPTEVKDGETKVFEGGIPIPTVLNHLKATVSASITGKDARVRRARPRVRPGEARVRVELLKALRVGAEAAKRIKLKQTLKLSAGKEDVAAFHLVLKP